MSGSGDNCGTTCPPNPCGSVTILVGYAKTFIVDLFYEDTRAPYDLTGATEIIAAFPPATGTTPILVSLTLGEVVVMGSPGAGRIQVKLSAAKSALVAANPYPTQNQNLQVSVTNADTSVTPFFLQGVLAISAPPYGVV